jgi:hypothetical protein
MARTLIDFGAGFVIGGLALSAAWGFFWLAIGLVGLGRRTCGWRVVWNSLAAGVLPLGLILGLLWWRSGGEPALSFGIGLAGMPVVLLGLGLRPAPDGQRVGSHMVDGVRRLKDELLGAHHECGGCSHEHDHGGCG